jgi:hypothetical protein
MLADTQMPPLSSKKLVEEIHDQVTRTVDD